MEEDLTRYSRQMAIPGIGKEGQLRLSRGKVLIVGCGALGSLVAMYLAAAGVGKLGLADFDTVDPTNLQRQLFYRESDAGMKKVFLLADSVKGLNSKVEVEPLERLVTVGNGAEMVCRYDIIVDATDNEMAKCAIDKLCRDAGKPCVTGGVEQMHGQVFTVMPESNVGYSDLFQTSGAEPGFTPCSVAGVLGPAAGVVASVQASEVIKLLTSAGTPLSSRMLVFDLASNTWSSFPIA